MYPKEVYCLFLDVLVTLVSQWPVSRCYKADLVYDFEMSGDEKLVVSVARKYDKGRSGGEDSVQFKVSEGGHEVFREKCEFCAKYEDIAK